MKLLKIYGYAMSKRDIESKLEEMAWNISEHIIKLYLYPKNGACRHWRREIASFLNSMSVLKGSNKLPSKQFIYKSLYNTQVPFFNQYIDYYLKEYGESDVEVNRDEIVDTISSYFHWISEQLSVNRRISYNQIYSKLDELGLHDNGNERFGEKGVNNFENS